jgi:hypothetical protein
MLQMRQNLASDTPNISAMLSTQRNNFRTKLVQAKEVRSMSSYEPLFVSILVRCESGVGYTNECLSRGCVVLLTGNR